MMEGWELLVLMAAPLAGGLAAMYYPYTGGKNLKLLLAFSGAYLFSITITRLLPEIFEEASTYTGLLILGGFFLQIILERFTHGIEHGHIHQHHSQHHQHDRRLPVSLWVGMGSHAFLEGMPLGGQILDGGLNTGLLIGIALHEVPAAFALTTVMRIEQVKGRWLLIGALAYACMAPLGAILSKWLLWSEFVQEITFHSIMAVVVGTFLHISTTILFENSEHHVFSRQKMIAIACGTGLALLSFL